MSIVAILYFIVEPSFFCYNGYIEEEIMKKILLVVILFTSLYLSGCSNTDASNSYIGLQLKSDTDLSIEESYYSISNEYSQKMKTVSPWLMMISKFDYAFFKDDDSLLLAKQEKMTDKLMNIAQDGSRKLAEIPYDTQKDYDTLVECKEALAAAYVQASKPIIQIYSGQ